MGNEMIPDQMTAVVLENYNGVEALRVEQRPIPQPGPDEVLVKISASPINPSDLAFLAGFYGFKPSTPVVPGIEGSGTVVAAGSGMMGKYLNGKRVAVVGQGGGIWTEYAVIRTSSAYPLIEEVTLEQGAMSVVNPLTAMAFLVIAKDGRHKSIVQSAAASALGQMVTRLCQTEGIQVINIVRRESQVELLKNQGAEIVLNSSDPNFDQSLTDVCLRHETLLGFDAVAGSMTMQMLGAMPRSSKVIVYGALSYEPVLADPGQLIFQDKSVEGFWLTNWMRKVNILNSLKLWRRAQRLLTTDLTSEVRSQYPLHDVQKAIKEYQEQMSGGKILLRPDGDI